MGLQNRVESLFATFTDLPEDIRKYAARQVAVVLGRMGESTKYNVRATAKKDGIHVGEETGHKMAATPLGRLFASCSQLEQVVDKLKSTKGFYLQTGAVEACITVPEPLIATLRKEMAEQAKEPEKEPAPAA